MLSNITLGQYFPGNSFLHRMDPRVKILSTMVFIVAIFLADSPLGYGIVAAFTALTIGVSRLPARLLWNAVKPLWIIIVFTVAVHIFSTPGTVVWKFGFLSITASQ